MIPFCKGRIGGGLDQLGARSDDPEDGATLGRLERRPIERMRASDLDKAKTYEGNAAAFCA